MPHSLPARWLAGASAVAALSAWAQGAAPVPAAPAPQAVQAAPARPALQGYQPFVDEKVAPWKQANDTVGQIGGWRAYAKEANQAAAAKDVPAPKAGGASGHSHTHGKPQEPKK